MYEIETLFDRWDKKIKFYRVISSETVRKHGGLYKTYSFVGEEHRNIEDAQKELKELL